MAKQILILRHAKSDWSQGLQDFERQLNDRGQKEAVLMGLVIKKLGIVPDLIMASPAKRAKLTANIVAKNCEYKSQIQWCQDFYFGDENQILAALQQLPDNIQRPMIVGHNETLEILTSRLASDGSLHIKLPTAAFASLNAPINNWKQLDFGMCELLGILTPKYVNKIVN